MKTMLLIHPPLVKPTEPPAGPARLAGALRRHGVQCTLVDANIEGLMFLLNRRTTGSGDLQGNPDDVWTKRSFRHLEENLSLIRSPEGYINMDRYKRAVMDVNRVLTLSSPAGGVRLSLSDYKDQQLSPLRSRDLIAATEHPEANPFHAYFSERIVALLNQDQPALIGLSLNYLSQALCCFAMIGFIRKTCPAVKIVLGGGLVTSWMQRPDWRDPFQGLVDEWVAGPGEIPLLALLGISHDGRPAMPDYSTLPLPLYLSPEFILPYSASSGCYWRRCAFCPEKAEANPYRPFPDDDVAGELGLLTFPHSRVMPKNPTPACEPLVGQGETDLFAAVPSSVAQGKKPILIHLLDNAVRPSLLKKLVMRPPGAPWYGFARVSKDLADPDYCQALKRAGCVMLKLGIESGSQRVLDHLDKGIDLETTVNVLKSLHQAGIATYVYLLFGTPQEREGDAFQTLGFVARHHEWIDFLNVAVFNLPAYGPDVEKLDTGAFYDGDLTLYRTFIHPAGWDRARVRKFLSREFKRHPAVAGILKRDPPFLTSNHAPLLILFRS